VDTSLLLVFGAAMVLAATRMIRMKLR